MFVGIAVPVADCRRDSLAEIKQLLSEKAPDLREVVKSTESLRNSYPSVNVAEQIYSEADRMSIYAESDPFVASSQLEFDFDDLVVDSAVYRRVMAAAKNHTSHLRRDDASGVLVQNEESVTISTHRRHASEKQDLNHERQDSQMKNDIPHQRQDDAPEASIVGKEITTISTRRGFGNDKHGRNHERQNIQTKQYAPHLRKDNAKEALIPGKENIVASAHRGLSDKTDDRSHKRKELSTEYFDAGESPNDSNSKQRVPVRVAPRPRKRKEVRRPPRNKQEDEVHENLIDFSDDDTMCQAVKNDLPQQVPRLFEDLVGLQFPATVCLS